MLTSTSRAHFLVLLSVPLFVGGCSKTEDKGSESDKQEMALTSPTLCEHVMAFDPSLDETRCILRLDGLQIQLGEEDWKTHGSCIAKAKSTAEYKACLNAADAFSLEKAAAQGQ